MLDLVTKNIIPAMEKSDIDKVRQLEERVLRLPQVDIETQHVFHAGIYARTIMVPAGVVATGTLIKRSTTLIVCGNAIVFIGDKTLELNGYYVLPASANRKQAVFAKSDTYLTMMFATDATTVEDAEAEFTDEVEFLGSRKNDCVNKIIVTGE